MKLPIADTATVRAYTGVLFRKHRRPLVLIAALHTLAATAGLAGPWLLGMLVDAVSGGTTATYINTLIAVGVVAVLAQTVLIRFAQRASMVFGEEVFAELREEFIEKVTALPLSVVERAGTGDLVARTTNDVNKLQHAVRFGVPRVIVAVVTISLTIVACLVLSPVVSLAMFIGVPTLLLVVRWYLKRATPAYQRESAAYAVLNGTITESVEGARTVDALRLGRRRMGRVDADLREAFEAEKVTLRLRTILFPGIDAAFVLAPAAVLLWGGYLASEGYVTVGAVTTIVLYTYQITGPVWELIFWVDEIQVAATSLARIVGVQLVEPDRETRAGTPVDEDIASRDLTYAYREGHNVLHGIDLDLGKAQVVGHRADEHVVLLGDQGDVPAQLLERQVDQRHATDRDRAVGGRVDAGEHPTERRLAGTGRSDHGQPLTGGQVEVDAVQHVVPLAVRVGQPPGGDVLVDRGALARLAVGLDQLDTHDARERGPRHLDLVDPEDQLPHRTRDLVGVQLSLIHI